MGNSTINFCRIIGNTGMDIYNMGSVNAENNWWGNLTGTNPQTSGRINTNVSTWIVLTLTATNPVNGTSTVTADLLHNNTGATVNGIVPYNGLVSFSATIGTINNTNMIQGKAVTTVNAGTTHGADKISATIDNATTTITLNF